MILLDGTSYGIATCEVVGLTTIPIVSFSLAIDTTDTLDVTEIVEVIVYSAVSVEVGRGSYTSAAGAAILGLSAIDIELGTPLTGSFYVEVHALSGSVQLTEIYCNAYDQIPSEGRTSETITGVLTGGGTSLPIGALSQDAVTPEQISLFLPFTGVVDDNAVASVEYKLTTSSTWLNAQPMWRILDQYAGVDGRAQGVVDSFATTIFNLSPARSYDVKVTVVSAQGSSVVQDVFPTRALPPAFSGNPTSTVTTQSALQAAVSAAGPGDIIEFSGQIVMSSLWSIDSVNGTEANPIVIRGDNRDTAELKFSATGISIVRCEYLRFENFTLRGNGINAIGTTLRPGVTFSNSYGGGQTAITFRNMYIVDFDQGIITSGPAYDTLIYDNILEGNNEYVASQLEPSTHWSDDGIRIGGIGGAIFNNTLSGYGDACSFRQAPKNGFTHSVNAVHFYRNQITDMCDDAVEAEYSQRNCSFYDNHATNCMVACSIDALYGGPYYHFRNRHINNGRSIIKCGEAATGTLFYHNTFVGNEGNTAVPGGERLWYWSASSYLAGWEVRNNLFIWEGAVDILRFDASISRHLPLTLTHNGWGRNGAAIRFANDARWGSVAYMNSQFTPLFDNDVEITDQAAVFETPVDMGTSYLPAKLNTYDLALSVTSEARDIGIELPNITAGT